MLRGRCNNIFIFSNKTSSFYPFTKFKLLFIVLYHRVRIYFYILYSLVLYSLFSTNKFLISNASR